MRTIVLLLVVVAPMATPAQGMNVGPAPALDPYPRPSVWNGQRSVLLSVPLGAPGCYPSGSALGRRGQVVTVSRNSEATYIDAAGVMRTCAANNLRVGTDGALLEPAATNLLPRSDEFGSSWAAIEVTVAPDVAAAPDGTSTMDKVEETDVAASQHRVQQTTTISAGATTLSVYTRPAERVWLRQRIGTSIAAYFNLSTCVTGTVTGGVATSSSTAGSCRSVLTGTATGNETIYLGTSLVNAGGTHDGVLGSGLYLWGAQLETGGIATSYIPTAGAPASRNADVVTMAADIPARYGGNWCRGGTWTPVGTWAQIGTLWSSGSGANSASLGASGSNLVFTVTDGASGTKTVTYALASIAAGARRIFACANGGTLGLYVDGVAVGSAAGAGTGLIATAPALSLGTNTLAALKDWKSCRVGAPKWDCR